MAAAAGLFGAASRAARAALSAALAARGAAASGAPSALALAPAPAAASAAARAPPASALVLDATFSAAFSRASAPAAPALRLAPALECPPHAGGAARAPSDAAIEDAEDGFADDFGAPADGIGEAEGCGTGGGAWAMNRNMREPRKANHGARPCSSIRRRRKYKTRANEHPYIPGRKKKG
jgi:hypothetical protein